MEIKPEIWKPTLGTENQTSVAETKIYNLMAKK